MNHQSRVIEQTFAGRRELYAAPTAFEQLNTERLLKPLDPGTGGCERKMGAIGATRDAAVIRNSNEELQVDKIEAHNQQLSP